MHSWWRAPGLLTSSIVTDLAALLRQHGDSPYREFFRGPAMFLGLFAAGFDHTDIQDPQGQDEVYVVLAGHWVIDIDGRQHPVARGSISYVPCGVPHHFRGTSDNLQVLVVIAPPLA